MARKPFEEDYRLVQRVLSGETSAWDALFSEILEPYINGLAGKAFLPRHPDLFEDAVMDAIYRIYSNLAKFRGEAKITTWSYYYVMNAISRNWKTLRHQRNSQDLDSVDQASGAHQRGPEQELERRFLMMKVDEVLSGMNPVYKKAIELQVLEGLSVEEIAARETVSIHTVKSWLKRARKKLYEHFERGRKGDHV
jgi:RNA polymerase sigma-70 factor (ECF subfamily)